MSKLSEPDVYGDGAGLWFRVTKNGSKYWIFRFMLNKKAHWMGLGPYPDVSLEEAREQALEARKKKYHYLIKLLITGNSILYLVQI